MQQALAPTPVALESPAALPERVDRFRAEYRRTYIGPRYRGLWHLAFTSLGSLGVIAFALSRLSSVRPVEWLVVPFSFLVANLAEYLGHKGPMHHRTRGLALIFKRHSQEHHAYFTHEAMECESTRDFKMILFPPVMLLFFLGAIATPIGALFFVLVSANAGWLFVATALGYFITYEWLHCCYHLPESHPLSRLPFMARLRRHHTTHHNPRLMADYNFNITFPICDKVFGTTWKPQG